MNKTFVTLAALAFAVAAQAQDATSSHKLTKVWETDAAPARVVSYKVTVRESTQGKEAK